MTDVSCPFQFSKVRHDVSGYLSYTCYRTGCAWWDHDAGRCCILSIAKSLQQRNRLSR